MAVRQKLYFDGSIPPKITFIDNYETSDTKVKYPSRVWFNDSTHDDTFVWGTHVYYPQVVRQQLFSRLSCWTGDDGSYDDPVSGVAHNRQLKLNEENTVYHGERIYWEYELVPGAEGSVPDPVVIDALSPGKEIGVATAKATGYMLKVKNAASSTKVVCTEPGIFGSSRNITGVRSDDNSLIFSPLYRNDTIYITYVPQSAAWAGPTTTQYKVKNDIYADCHVNPKTPNGPQVTVTSCEKHFINYTIGNSVTKNILVYNVKNPNDYACKFGSTVIQHGKTLSNQTATVKSGEKITCTLANCVDESKIGSTDVYAPAPNRYALDMWEFMAAQDDKKAALKVMVTLGLCSTSADITLTFKVFDENGNQKCYDSIGVYLNNNKIQVHSKVDPWTSISLPVSYNHTYKVTATASGTIDGKYVEKELTDEAVVSSNGGSGGKDSDDKKIKAPVIDLQSNEATITNTNNRPMELYCRGDWNSWDGWDGPCNYQDQGTPIPAGRSMRIIGGGGTVGRYEYIFKDPNKDKFSEITSCVYDPAS